MIEPHQITSYIFLDDVRYPSTTNHVQLPTAAWTIVRDYKQFVDTIEVYYAFHGNLPEFIAFDHDLADEHYRKSMYDTDEHYSAYYTNGTFKEKTGYDCAKWLVDFCLKDDRMLDIPDYLVHSMNPIGKKNIISILESYKQHKQKELNDLNDTTTIQSNSTS
jgi:hypothetical protein